MHLILANSPFFYFVGFWCLHCPFWDQERFGNDPEPYGSVLFQYEPIPNHMDPFQSQFHDFHQKNIQDLVLDLVQFLDPDGDGEFDRTREAMF